MNRPVSDTHTRGLIRVITGLIGAALLLSCQFSAGTSQPPLAQQIERIDAQTPGELGVYVKHLGSSEELSYKADRRWYIASMVKIPVAIAVLQAVEAGELSLEQTVTLAQSDYVDGAGDLLYHDPGDSFTIAELIAHSIENSDSTATDILMRTLGVEALNRAIATSIVAEGVDPFTTILQVRFDAYGELHPRAGELSNMDYVEIRSAGEFDARVEAFARKLGLQSTQLKTNELETAFQRYYQRNLNSATLQAMGSLLERLVAGELLNPNHSQRLLKHMQNISTGERRLQAGLPSGTPFAQKTGSQIQRACNMGVTHPQQPARATIIVSCAENFGDIEQAETAFANIAQVISKSKLFSNSQKP